MTRRDWLIVGLSLTCAFTAGTAIAQRTAGAPTAGVVKHVSGIAVLERGGQREPITAGSHVDVGDILRTGTDGAIGIALADDTLLAVGAESELVLSAYSFDSTTQDGSLLTSVWRGSVAFVTGLIAKKAPEKVRVQTRTVVLGVRGTEFIVDAGQGTP